MKHKFPQPETKMNGFFLSKIGPSGVGGTTVLPFKSGQYGWGPLKPQGQFFYRRVVCI